MPSTSEKQKRFFGAVMGAKKGQKGVSGKAKKVAKELPKKEIKKFLKGPEDEEDNINTDTPNTEEHSSKKKRKKMEESTDIASFIESILNKNYAEANKYLNNAVELKIQKRIEQELAKPLF